MEQVLNDTLLEFGLEDKINILSAQGINTVGEFQSFLNLPPNLLQVALPNTSIKDLVAFNKARQTLNHNTQNKNFLPWITRGIESTVRKWLETEAAVVLVRGHRRVGKSSTITHVAEQCQRSFKCIYVTSSRKALLKEFSDKLNKDITAIYKIGDALCDAVMRGDIIILEEIQNASDELQVSLQAGIDKIAYCQKIYTTQNAGVLFLMGSLPGVVDSMVESRNAALYQRVIAKLTILAFDTQELCSLFKCYNLHLAPYIMLTLKTILGGKPFLYEQAAKASLLHHKVSAEELLKEFFASELQQTSNDAIEYYRLMLGNDLGSALKATLSHKDKSSQLAEVRNLTWVKQSKTDAFVIVDGLLHQRYGLIEPVYSMKKKTVIEYYKSADTLIDLAEMKAYWSTIKREDVHRICNKMVEKVAAVEGFQFERWIREILEDRKLLLNIPVIPGPSFNHLNDIFLLEKNISWSNKQSDIKEVEIDILGSFPANKTLIVGSCKRSFSQHNEAILRDHWEKCVELLVNGTYSGLASRLKIGNLFPEAWTVYFLHFSVTKDCDSNRIHSSTHYYFSLMDLLEPFFK